MSVRVLRIPEVTGSERTRSDAAVYHDRAVNDLHLSRELSGISSRHDEAAATAISGGMGLSESTEFRACIQARAT